MAHNPALGCDEYTLCSCAHCGQPIMVKVGATEAARDVSGQRHVCGNVGQPLLRSGLAGLQPMGGRQGQTLRK